MGWYRDRVLPQIIDKALHTDEIATWRRLAIDGISGIVVEPGFGSGLNLPLMPPDVTKVFAIAPAVRGRELAADRIAASPIEVEFVGLDGQKLPLPDDSCDNALLTYTLCTIPDPNQALSELRRVLKPGGVVRFLEHGKGPTERLQKMQRLIDPVQKRLADGCHVSRDHPALFTDAGFDLVSVTAGFGEGPKPWVYYYVGRALNPE